MRGGRTDTQHAISDASGLSEAAYRLVDASCSVSQSAGLNDARDDQTENTVRI